MTVPDPLSRSVRDAIEQLIVDYPDLPVGVVVRTATAAVRSVQLFGDLGGDQATVVYLIARQELDLAAADMREMAGADAAESPQPRSARS